MSANAIPVPRPCPLCARVGRPLIDASQEAHVNYYRCDDCWHTWALSKDHPEEPPIAITVPKPVDRSA